MTVYLIYKYLTTLLSLSYIRSNPNYLGKVYDIMYSTNYTVILYFNPYAAGSYFGQYKVMQMNQKYDKSPDTFVLI